MSCVNWERHHYKITFPANTGYWPNAVLMLTHRLRRWASISTASGQRLVFAGHYHSISPSHYLYSLYTFCIMVSSQQQRGIHPMLFQCWASVEDGGPTLQRHRVNVSVCWDTSDLYYTHRWFSNRGAMYRYSMTVACILMYSVSAGWRGTQS